jgi:hypothetical protein
VARSAWLSVKAQDRTLKTSLAGDRTRLHRWAARLAARTGSGESLAGFLALPKSRGGQAARRRAQFPEESKRLRVSMEASARRITKRGDAYLRCW